MDQTKVKNQVLAALYDDFFTTGEYRNLHHLLDQEGWDRTPFWNLIDRMYKEGLILGRPGGSYRLDAPGVIHVEEAGIAPEELFKTNQQARTQILLALAKVYDEKGSLYSAANSDLMEETGFDKNILLGNLLVLLGLDYAESSGNAGSRITIRGLEAVEQYRRQKGLADEFETVSKMSPQPRGRALQKLLAKVCERNGWGQEESVRTSNEEMDVIVFRDREYYLLECKWEKDPIEAEVVRELFGKLGNRIDVRGIIVSMSGFTKGAVKQVEDYIGQRIILLFGEADVKALLYGRASFNDLLNAKYKELVTKRKVVFS